MTRRVPWKLDDGSFAGYDRLLQNCDLLSSARRPGVSAVCIPTPGNYDGLSLSGLFFTFVRKNGNSGEQINK